jgi:hypothetical protein
MSKFVRKQNNISTDLVIINWRCGQFPMRCHLFILIFKDIIPENNIHYYVLVQLFHIKIQTSLNIFVF